MGELLTWVINVSRERGGVYRVVLSGKGGHVWKMLTRLKNVAVGSALPAYEVAFGKHRAAFQLGQASGLRSLFKSSGTEKMRERERERGSS